MECNSESCLKIIDMERERERDILHVNCYYKLITKISISFHDKILFINEVVVVVE